MKKRVYIETSVPSFYVETRTEPDMIARRDWTREWWDYQRKYYELVTSLAVIEELERGVHPNREEALQLIADLPLLPNVEAIDAIVGGIHCPTCNAKRPRRRCASFGSCFLPSLSFSSDLELPASCECQ